MGTVQPAPVPQDKYACDLCPKYRKGKPRNMGQRFVHGGYWACNYCQRRQCQSLVPGTRMKPR